MFDPISNLIGEASSLLNPGALMQGACDFVTNHPATKLLKCLTSIWKKGKDNPINKMTQKCQNAAGELSKYSLANVIDLKYPTVCGNTIDFLKPKMCQIAGITVGDNCPKNVENPTSCLDYIKYANDLRTAVGENPCNVIKRVKSQTKSLFIKT